MAAVISVPFYACAVGTIPLIREWLVMGMSMDSASVFMITEADKNRRGCEL